MSTAQVGESVKTVFSHPLHKSVRFVVLTQEEIMSCLQLYVNITISHVDDTK